MDETERHRLDRVEGLGRGYELLRAQVRTPNGPRVAFTYTGSAGSLDDTVRPYSWYKRILVRGARQNQLPQAYINQLQSVPTVEDPTRA
jgi:gamma-glutamylcyclotransferase